MRSLKLSEGDELIVLDQAYGACRAALDYVAERAGARVVVVSLPVPIASDEAVVAQVLEAVTERTQFALLDAVISPTGWVLPIERLVAGLKQRQVETLVDAAHSPGLTPMALTLWRRVYRREPAQMDLRPAWLSLPSCPQRPSRRDPPLCAEPWHEPPRR